MTIQEMYGLTDDEVADANRLLGSLNVHDSLRLAIYNRTADGVDPSDVDRFRRYAHVVMNLDFGVPRTAA